MDIATLAQAAAAAGNESYLLWGFILGGVALGLLMLELIVPSGGLLGLLCGLAVIASIVAFFRYDTGIGLAATITYVVLTPIALVFIFKLWLHSPIGRRMVLGGDESVSTDDEARRRAEETRSRRQEQLQQLIGAEGVTETALRPVGFVKIGGQRVDAMAESGVIEAGTPVLVTDVYDNQIKVRPRS